jgi:hypothetical protein
MMFNSQKKKEELMEFFFCNDDIERCVKGLKRRWVKSKLDVPDIWPMKLDINLTKKEILALENAGFHRIWLAREPGAGSGEQGAGKKRAGSRDCRKKSQNR